MRALLVALGNRLRRDDGVAHHVLDRLSSAFDLEPQPHPLLQLTPEVADDIAGYEAVIFLDADAGAAELSIERVDESPYAAALTHISTPAQIVGLSRALFGFAGQAWLCRIPVNDLSSGEELSRQGRAFAAQASEELERLLTGLRVAACHRI